MTTAADTGTTDAETTSDPELPDDARSSRRSRGLGARVSISVWTLVFAALTVLLAITAGVFGFAWASADGRVDDANQAAASEQKAERVATDYAIGASNIDVKDFQSWVGRLKANTAPALATKFDASAPKLEQILVPLKWVSTATPVAAKVVSSDHGVYQVMAFLNVSSTSAQNPDGAQTTVTYDVTVDSNNGWKVTDVGGLDGAVPAK